MAYCGAIGNVNVLEFMSTELFDESQENPFLLSSAQSPSQPKWTGAQSTLKPALKVSVQARPEAELPLSDKVGTTHKVQFMSPHQVYKPVVAQQRMPTGLPFTPIGSVPGMQPFAMAWQAARSPMQAAAPVSPMSQASTVASSVTSMMDHLSLDAHESEIHKLLYNLNTPYGQAVSHPSPTGAPGYSAPPSPSGFGHSGSVWLRQPDEVAPVSPVSSAAKAMKKKKRIQNAKRQKKQAKSTRQHQFESQDAIENPESNPRVVASRGSVTFATVKALLRGGGGLTSRIVKRPEMDFRRKSMGTICSRMKRRQKFQRPTILTDAYHRVSNMRLGTQPMKASIKHLRFPNTWKEMDNLKEDDPGMPRLKGVMHRESLVTLETLDKIGTRAACPVHLIEEPSPDYSKVRSRVDSYNHLPRPKKVLRRPTAWLLGATPVSSPSYDTFYY
ncbi:TPA: hypothetical protein N0F65_002012 [Lagenidium giganteum]|uniref:Uncharacterized protein n=1 Tax=Lagenidium giganteum TaxID=4803 RepID=A0AAV2Z1U8_9STRA|nr:TPA: hypothetical protein N0F65_002012 [Lagenidium giganteum]